MAKKMHRNSLQPDYKLHWYTIERILGQGGFGITYLAYDYNLDRRVAIKEYLPMELAVREGDFSVYPASESQDERYRWGLERFITEARTLAKFKHPNIVRVLSVFEENNTAYMVMEYEHGESMQDLLSRRGTLEEQEIIKIILPIMGGLELVHKTGFIHRDIKPANIFLREDESPVLLDFGSARQALGEKTKSLTSIVSPGYAPFEQYYSKSDRQGPWTDIYGLGATMYRAISGRAPMDAIDRSEAILKAERDIFVPAHELGQGRYSQRFLQAIDHAIKFSEKDRPQSIRDWLEEFAVPGEAPESAPAPVTGSAASTATRTRFAATDDEATSIDLTTGEVFAPTVKMDPSSEQPSGVDIETVIDPGFQPLARAGKRTYRNIGLLIIALLAIAAGGFYTDQGQDLISKWAGKNGLAPVKKTRPVPPHAATPPAQPGPGGEETGPPPVAAVPDSAVPAGSAAARAEPEAGSEPVAPSATIPGSTESVPLTTQPDQVGDGILPDAIPSVLSSGSQVAAPIEAEQPETVQPEIVQPQEIEPATKTATATTETPSPIELLLEQAGAALAAGRLTRPEADNALALYRQAEQLDAADTRVQAGLNRVGILLAARAEQALAKDDFERAGEDIDTALGLRPGDTYLRGLHSQLQQAQRREADQQRISELLGQARQAQSAGHLVRPGKANALAYYRQVLALEPGNIEAESGLTAIADGLAEEAAQSARENDFTSARKALNQALAIHPGSARLKADSERLQQAEADWRAAHDKAARIKGLLRDADADLAALRLTSPKDNNALEKYRQVGQLDPGNPRATAGLQHIVDRYVALAGKAGAVAQLDKAAAYLDKADRVLPGAGNVRLARESLALQRAAIRQRQEQQAHEQEAAETARRQAEGERQRQQEAQRQVERERQAREAEATRQARLQAEQEQRRLAEEKARLEEPSMSLRITGLGERYKQFGVSAAKLAQRIVGKLIASGWKVLGENEIGQRPNALLMHVKFHANYNDSTGIYSYAVSVNIRERAKLPESDDIFAPVPIWSKGQNGIAQAHDFGKLNGIIMKFVDQFLAGNSRR